MQQHGNERQASTQVDPKFSNRFIVERHGDNVRLAFAWTGNAYATRFHSAAIFSREDAKLLIGLLQQATREGNDVV